MILVYIWRYVRGCRYYFELGIENSNCVWIEDAESGILEFIYIMIIDSGDCKIEYMISRSVVVEIV